MTSAVSILGSTGSIGTQTIKTARRLGISVLALAANSSSAALEEQARLLHPRLVAVFDQAAARDVKIRLADTDIRVVSGETGLLEAAVIDGADAVCTALSGAAGLKPTLAALDAKKRVCLANKETLVCAGEIVMSAALARKAEIIPVDSEHSAIFQCLAGRGQGELKKILLTASGGPFLGKSRAETKNVTPEMAVRHPNWSMGAKISVDSATMMNKGLEFIEAMHLFGVSPDMLEVVIHPESVIHSMVELTDGSVIAQCAAPDMALPIQYALTYPERLPSDARRLDFPQMPALSFFAPRLEDTPCLALATASAEGGGNLPCCVSAADEIAVSRFLRGEIGYNEIYDCILSAYRRIDFIKSPSLSELLETDAVSRRLAAEY